MIRSIVHATDIPYRTVHRIMHRHGWRAADRLKADWDAVMINTLKDLGFAIEKISFSPKGGKRGVNGHTVCKRYPGGTFIINQPYHVSCVRDGVLLDTEDCRDVMVYNMWRIVKIPIIK